MTDDKGAGGEMQAQAGICKRCFDDHDGDDCVGYARSQGFIAGRKAERARYAHIAEHEAGEIPECMTGRIIAEKIRGGQDGK